MKSRHQRRRLNNGINMYSITLIVILMTLAHFYTSLYYKESKDFDMSGIGDEVVEAIKKYEVSNTYSYGTNLAPGEREAFQNMNFIIRECASLDECHSLLVYPNSLVKYCAYEKLIKSDKEHAFDYIFQSLVDLNAIFRHNTSGCVPLTKTLGQHILENSISLREFNVTPSLNYLVDEEDISDTQIEFLKSMYRRHRYLRYRPFIDPRK